MELSEMLPILLPLIVLDVLLAVFSLVHILRHPHVRYGNKWIWCAVVVVIQLFGPILYFIIGRGEE